ncbi:MAG: hypothetical protein ACK5ME_12315 [Parahaliea sp.]
MLKYLWLLLAVAVPIQLAVDGHLLLALILVPVLLLMLLVPQAGSPAALHFDGHCWSGLFIHRGWQPLLIQNFHCLPGLVVLHWQIQERTACYLWLWSDSADNEDLRRLRQCLLLNTLKTRKETTE